MRHALKMGSICRSSNDEAPSSNNHDILELVEVKVSARIWQARKVKISTKNGDRSLCQRLGIEKGNHTPNL
uniref:Uncharacterized protein n=1 Tax=Salix viminalis TaxID=40686 RepID=A0A6N2L0J2_SALVM